MCGRFVLTTSTELLGRLFGVPTWLDSRGRSLGRGMGRVVPELKPRYNIAPSQDVAIIRAQPQPEGPPTREIALARWGLIPSWASEPDIGIRTINCRCETADTKPAFRMSFRTRRCIVPADAFYEWQARGRGPKQPMCITIRPASPDSPSVFGMAGLWDRWERREGENPAVAIESCTILTTAANAFMQTIHDRMPVILRPTDYDAWLDLDTSKPAALDSLRTMCRPYPPELMAAHPVSTFVNSPRIDDPRCAQPIDPGDEFAGPGNDAQKDNQPGLFGPAGG